MRADFRHAWRGLKRSPAFTAAATLTLALGVGISLALLAAARAALVTPLPYTSPEHLVHVSVISPREGRPIPASYPEYREWRHRTRAFVAIAGYSRSNRTLTGFGAPVRVSAAPVSTNFFTTLGVTVHGRQFRTEEERAGSDRAAIVTHGFWRQYLGSDPAALGTFVRLNDVPHEVVGILPASFRFDLEPADLFVPLGITEADEARPDSHWVHVVARLDAGVTLASGAADLEAIPATTEPDRAHRVSLEPLREATVGTTKQVLLVLVGAAFFVMVSASASVANLVSARAAARRREYAVRFALGASRAVLWRLAASELALLGLLAAGLAILSSLALAAAAASVMPASAASAVRYLREVALDPFVVAGAALLALLALAPSILVLVPEVRRWNVPGLVPDSRRVATAPARRWLVAIQVAVAIVLLIGTGLLGRSVARLLHVDLGFDPSRLVAVKVSLPPDRYPRPPQIVAFYDALWRAMSQLPGIESAGVIDELPLTKDDGLTRVWRAPERNVAGREVESVFRSAGPGYFATMGIGVHAGRGVEEQDTSARVPVAVLNRTLAGRLFPDGDAIGRQVAFGPRGTYDVIGIVEDVRMGELDRDIRPAIYTSALQNPSRSCNLVVRTTMSPAAVLAAARDIVARLDPDVPAYSARTFWAIRNETRAFSLRASVLYPLALFGALTIVVAAIGVHGLLHYLVVQRTREIGVRMALGATQRDVLRLALARGLAPVLPGIAGGVAAALVGSRILASLLFGVDAIDAGVFVGTAAGVFAVALLACYLPARRAARLDPVRALAAD